MIAELLDSLWLLAADLLIPPRALTVPARAAEESLYQGRQLPF